MKKTRLLLILCLAVAWPALRNLRHTQPDAQRARGDRPHHRQFPL